MCIEHMCTYMCVYRCMVSSAAHEAHTSRNGPRSLPSSFHYHFYHTLTQVKKAACFRRIALTRVSQGSMTKSEGVWYLYVHVCHLEWVHRPYEPLEFHSQPYSLSVRENIVLVPTLVSAERKWLKPNQPFRGRNRRRER